MLCFSGAPQAPCCRSLTDKLNSNFFDEPSQAQTPASCSVQHVCQLRPLAGSVPHVCQLQHACQLQCALPLCWQLVHGCRGCMSIVLCLLQASVTCAITAPIQIPDYKAIAGDKEV